MSTGGRRIFWGHSLPQALARAARHHQIAIERLAYRIHEKRSGFVRHPRAVLIEVDPVAPERPTTAPAPPYLQATATPSRAAAAERRSDRWESPDDDSELAAREATMRLLRFSGLEARASVRRADDSLAIELATTASAPLAIELLEDLEHLLQNAVAGLAGRRVRCQLDGNGVRASQREGLRAWARAAAERVRSRGTEELTPALAAAERRIVHLVLAGDPEVATESRGEGELKTVRIFRTGAPP